jgi:hypothetical protein
MNGRGTGSLPFIGSRFEDGTNVLGTVSMYFTKTLREEGGVSSYLPVISKAIR